MKTTRIRYLGIEFKVFAIIGITGSVAGAIFAPVDLWAKLAIGYGAMAIICASFMLGAWDTWKELRDDAFPLAKLREEQKQNPRPYIHPILIWIDWNSENIRLHLALSNFLVFEQKIIRLSGKLFIEGQNPIQIPAFRNVPRTLFPATISSPFSETVLLSATIKSYVQKLYIEKNRKPAIRLTLSLERPDGDPINFDPPIDHPLRLSFAAEGRIGT